MSARERWIRLAGALIAGAALAGCGSDNGGGGDVGPPPTTLTAGRAAPSGDGQVSAPGTDLPQPLRIVVRRGEAPEAGAVVNWSAAGAGASLTPAVDTTGADGISTSTWHLGTAPGVQSAQAEVAGAEGSPVPFSATATAPGGQPGEVQIRLVNAGGNRFEPANVTVPVGTKVTWTWVGGFHDVSSTTFTGSGDPVNPPHSYSVVFSTPGDYLYFCSVHGSPNGGMRGTIVVR